MPPIRPWPDWLDDVWAKSPDEPGRSGESLALHTWRVLERLRDLSHLHPALPVELGEPRLWHRLFWACLCHDLGKAAPGFQERLRAQPVGSAARRWGQHRHEVISLAFVAWLFPPARPGETADPIVGSDRRWVTGAIVSHHRDAAEIASLYPEEADAGLTEMLASLPSSAVEGIHRWLGECALAWAGALGLTGVAPVTLPPASEAVDLVCGQGTVRVRSLLREYRRWVKQLVEQPGPTTSEILLRGLLLQADHAASAHTRPLVPVMVRTSELRDRWNLATTYQHQERCATTNGSAMLMAPTGSGKTEAALLWAVRQAEQGGGLPRLFYALPYQASMNAMYRRLDATFAPRQVGLQHGRALLALYRFVMEQEPDPARATRQARWRHDLARLNYFPVRVFSPYQMLKTMYRLKGYEAVLLDYYGAAFIFDEIHAYAPERLGLLLALVEHLRTEFNARFLVMSATLPAIARRHLAEAIGPHTVVQADPAIYQAFRRHRVRLLDGEVLDHLDLIAQRARHGASILVCCNTVQRAQDAWRTLRELLKSPAVVLLHGRFNGRDRLGREETVREATGVRSETRRPIVLVATQVVEVSLDVDFDTIFSDPAPLEALIQRFGRVNRRRQQTDLAPVHIFREPADGQHVYADSLIRAALTILERAADQPIDEAGIDTWLDDIYRGDAAATWEGAFEKALSEGRRILAGLRPFHSEENLAAAFDAAFDSVEVLPADLLPEYQRLHEDDPIRASELLVSISERRHKQLWRDGLIRPNTRPSVVDVPYSTEIGLDFSGLRGPGE